MRIVIVCNDSRGGVQPYVALGLGLRAAGHDVRAVTPSDLTELFSSEGIPVAGLSGSIEAVLRQSGGAAEGGPLAAMRLAAREMPLRIRAWTRETLAACEGADVITGGIGGMAVGLSVAEKLGRPFVEAHLQPVGAPSDTSPGVMFSGVPAWLGPWGMRLSHRLTEMAIWMPFQRAMQSAREDELGLRGRPTATDGQPVLYGFSPRVVQVPMDGPRPRHVTGYWSLPAPTDWTSPPDLEEFLSRGGPAVSVGFGSMPNQDPQTVTEMVRGAARDAGVRAVLLSGWGGLADGAQGDDVYCARALPHDQLFPRMAAVVHHGGAGTTGAALRAGVPAVVVPFTMDQPYWGARVAALGAGPVPIPRRQLTRARLATALRTAVTDTPLRTRAATLGAQLRAEDGVHNAVAVYNRLG